MSRYNKKIVSICASFALALTLGGVCYGSVQAAVAMPMRGDMHMAMPCVAYCLDSGAQSTIQTSAGNAILPCCADNHAVAQTILTNGTEDRIKLSAATSHMPSMLLPTSSYGLAYFSSSSPPPEGDHLFSIIKIE